MRKQRVHEVLSKLPFNCMYSLERKMKDSKHFGLGSFDVRLQPALVCHAFKQEHKST